MSLVDRACQGQVCSGHLPLSICGVWTFLAYHPPVRLGHEACCGNQGTEWRVGKSTSF
jgi:hypothetical protein